MAEIAGAVGLLVGLKVTGLDAAAAIGVVAYFIGAVVTHVRAKDKSLGAPAMFESRASGRSPFRERRSVPDVHRRSRNDRHRS